MRIVLYARVSTDDKEQDPERQLMKLRQYVELHEHVIIGEIVDFCTGDSDPLKRESGCHLLDGNPDGILFFSMDRFSRQHPTKIMKLIGELKNRGVLIVSITEPIFNMESEFAEVMIFLLTWWNNYFLTKLRRDIKSGMERARANGKQIGRRNATFNKPLAYELLFVKKMSQREVARSLNASLATINRFKRGIEKNGVSYIHSAVVSKGSVSETKKGV